MSKKQKSASSTTVFAKSKSSHTGDLPVEIAHLIRKGGGKDELRRAQELLQTAIDQHRAEGN